jgi:hypothetical protein
MLRSSWVNVPRGTMANRTTQLELYHIRGSARLNCDGFWAGNGRKEFFDCPPVVCKPCGLRWRLLGGVVKPAEIPVTGEQGYRMAQIFELFGESQGEAGKPAVGA